MRFNFDFVYGEWLSFDDIARRYALKFPGDKELTARGLLSPSTISKNRLIRAVFARQQTNGPHADLLFISSDNPRKNYLQRFEHYLSNQQPFYYFRRDLAPENQHRWQVIGEVRVCAMLDPASVMTQNLLLQRGYTLSLMHSDPRNERWQLFDPQLQPCFEHAQALQFIVVLNGKGLTPASGVFPGAQVGLRVKKRLISAAEQRDFQAAVRQRYGACVITGTLLTGEHNWPWVEACYINDGENSEGLIADSTVDNGLFLRSDLLRLFCSRRLHIDGDSGRVQLRLVQQEDQILFPFYQQLNDQVCVLWSRVPAATRARLSRRY
ncbi:HNH endonuclease [Erwinia sp. OLTSP20]|uniref:HNH endonuclease signature motif containing protein n=1 Tax=unclassified Erwinia TaxID=2622719 RepID=UPI000C1A0961|nr:MULTISPECIES: HNH endonuclease signature motif containing protein [unclassified Erwinia]PIJ48342.1 HNH endonuclease [Erwinia sp. OAMSP11]PIJ68695.1 HNH endonuclease [Erwinia sp. OLSSP12]PIJ78843.1 HNH endonuclease [Erwinia sp. OLCASP19]PIJ79813.1 HNH endonuclease [Erwinia sp. OLMTSP26]PIJ81218.1 HNH endonuclease [Erwinia sp. OLMDSP33]